MKLIKSNTFGRVTALFFFAIVLIGCNENTIDNQYDTLRVVSYNLKNAQSDLDSWERRRDKIVTFIDESEPDIFAIQEADEPWVGYLSEKLSRYTYIGKGRDNGEDKGESTGIYYLTEKFELLDSGVFWLSDTPNIPSKSWGAAHNRTTTYMKLKSQATKQQFTLYNTHLDHASQEARDKGTDVILAHVKQVDGAVIITGDFNFLAHSDIYQKIETNGFWDTRWLAKQVSAFSTLNWFINDFDTGFVIDFIFVRPVLVEVEQYRVDTSYFYEQGGARVPVSDHYPVIVDVRLTR